MTDEPLLQGLYYSIRTASAHAVPQEQPAMHSTGTATPR